MNHTAKQNPSSPVNDEFADFFINKRILVTGATGFIGYHLCNVLLNLNADVFGTALDGVFQPEIKSIPLTYLDLRDIDALNKFVRIIHPDYVFHLASLVNTNKEIGFVLPTLQSNLVGTINLMLSLEKSPIEKMIVISSSEAPSGYEPPNSPYAASKLAVNAYASMFHSLYGFPVSTARLFTCFGPFQPRNKLIPHIIDSVLRNNHPTLSTPKNELDFIYVKDFVRGLLYSAKSRESAGKTLDFGNGCGIQVEKMVGFVSAIIKQQNNIPLERVISGDTINAQIADIQHTIETTGWSPKWTMEKALLETIDWYRSTAN